MRFLQRELKSILKVINRGNFYVSSWSLNTTWGGTAHMFMFLEALKDLSHFKKTRKWNWDFVINLSESDFTFKYCYIHFKTVNNKVSKILELN